MTLVSNEKYTDCVVLDQKPDKLVDFKRAKAEWSAMKLTGLRHNSDTFTIYPKSELFSVLFLSCSRPVPKITQHSLFMFIF